MQIISPVRFDINRPPAEEALHVVDVAVERLVHLREVLRLACAHADVAAGEAGEEISHDPYQPYSGADARSRPEGDDEPRVPTSSPAAFQPLAEAFSEAGPAPERLAASELLSEPAGSSQAHRRFDWDLE